MDRSALLMRSLLLCALARCSGAQCDSCVEYCCSGSPPFCCSYYAYVGDVLSGTAISGIVFAVVFLMGAVAALFLCVCVCMKGGRGRRVGVFNVSTVSHGYPGPPPPYPCDYEMCPPPYTPTQPPPRTSPPPPYPGSKTTDQGSLCPTDQ